MEQYRLERERQVRNSRLAGAGLTIVVCIVVGCILVMNGLSYTFPPPPEQSPITLDFSEEPIQKVTPKQHKTGKRPTVANPDPTKDVKLVKQAKSPVETQKEIKAEEANVNDYGDVVTPTPAPDTTVKKQAMFPGTKNKTKVTPTSPHAAVLPTDEVEPGHPNGIIKLGDPIGEPNARLAGRTVIGALPLPTYSIQESGKVVVKIKVNRDGAVVEAWPGDPGTTLTNKTAWEAAKKVALEAQFNMKSDAPEYQYGTITYIFNITK